MWQSLGRRQALTGRAACMVHSPLSTRCCWSGASPTLSERHHMRAHPRARSTTPVGSWAPPYLYPHLLPGEARAPPDSATVLLLQSGSSTIHLWWEPWRGLMGSLLTRNVTAIFLTILGRHILLGLAPGIAVLLPSTIRSVNTHWAPATRQALGARFTNRSHTLVSCRVAGPTLFCLTQNRCFCPRGSVQSGTWWCRPQGSVREARHRKPHSVGFSWHKTSKKGQYRDRKKVHSYQGLGCEWEETANGKEVSFLGWWKCKI